MKVQISLKTASSAEANSTFDLVVGPEDTVASVKDRVSVLQAIPFPDQDLLLDGEVLQDGQQLSDCGVKELSSLDLVARASEKHLVQQLSELLKARDLSCDELGLLYCYKHGVSVSQALQMLGLNEKLQDFVRRHKTFQLENNHVALIRQDTALKPFSVASEVEQILKGSNTGGMEIKELCTKFTAKFNVSLNSLVGMKPIEFFVKQKDTFVVSGRIVSLKSAQQARQPQPKSWQQITAAEKSLVEPPPGLAAGPPAPVESAADQDSAESQPYLDLHNKICSRSFNSKVVQALNDVVEVVSQTVCLNVARVVKGGSVGKGTSISGSVDAEVVFFLKGLPPTSHERWLPPLLRAVAGVLSDRLGEEKGLEGIRATEDSVQMRVKGLVNADLRFSPVFNSYAHAIQTLSAQGPDTRKFYNTALVEERVQFIMRQPSSVKVTIRLLKWWRDQQEWSSKLARPSDDILELMAVYSAVQTKPADQRTSIANVMSLLSRFDELRIVWSNYYTKSDVWPALLRQRPLLMDPVNPFMNIADPQSFDARELMGLAKTTHFFW